MGSDPLQQLDDLWRRVAKEVWPHTDQGDFGASRSQPVRKRGIAAVVGNLENVDIDWVELELGGDLHVACHQERGTRRPDEDDDRLIIGAVVAPLGSQHLENHPRQAEACPDPWGHHWYRCGLHLLCDPVPGGIGVVVTGFPYLADRESLRESDQPGDVVVMGMGGNDQSQATDPILIERLPEPAGIGPAVDKDRLPTGRDQQRRVALADVDENHGGSAQSSGHNRHHQDYRGENKHHRSPTGPMDGQKNRRRHQSDRSDAELGIPGGGPGDRENEVASGQRRPKQRSRPDHYPDRSQESRDCHQRGRGQVGDGRKQWNAVALGEEKRRHRGLGGDRDTERFPDQLREAGGQQVVADHDPHRRDQRELETEV